MKVGNGMVFVFIIKIVAILKAENIYSKRVTGDALIKNVVIIILLKGHIVIDAIKKSHLMSIFVKQNPLVVLLVCLKLVIGSVISVVM